MIHYIHLIIEFPLSFKAIIKLIYYFHLYMSVIYKLLLLGFFSIALHACNLIPSVDEESLPNTARVGVVSLMYD